MFEGAERDTWRKPDEVVKQLQLHTGDVVADIGAGTRYFTRRFATAVGPRGKALGLDIEATMVTHINSEAQKQGIANLNARQVPPNDPQLGPQSVDVVFICNTYHHNMQERVAYTRLLAQALKPGGRVVIIDFHKRPLLLGPPVEWKLTSETVTEESGITQESKSAIKCWCYAQHQHCNNPCDGNILERSIISQYAHELCEFSASLCPSFT